MTTCALKGCTERLGKTNRSGYCNVHRKLSVAKPRPKPRTTPRKGVTTHEVTHYALGTDVAITTRVSLPQAPWEVSQ